MSDRGQRVIRYEPPPSAPAPPPPPPARHLHTYMLQQWRMRIGSPLTFSDGERIVAVVESSPVPGLSRDIDVTVLVEMP